MTEALTPSYRSSDQQPMPSLFITPYSPESIGGVIRTAVTATVASATYPAANRALYFPFTIRRAVTVYRFFWLNGTTASTDNVQAGVYDITGKSVALGAATLAAGTSACQFDNVADFNLEPGDYFIAIWCNGTTTHMIRNNGALHAWRSAGCYQESSLAGGLPATATFANAATQYCPVFGLALRSTP